MDAGAAVYSYDGEGRRLKKTVSGISTFYFYGPGGVLCEFTTTNTGATAAASADKTLYRTSDRLGSAVLVINAAGMVIENNRTLPYGEAWLSDTASTNDQKFTTYIRDTESSLDCAMARYFGFPDGRFRSVDPADPNWMRPQNANRYIYSLNDPLNIIDPTGKECTSIEIWDSLTQTFKIYLDCTPTPRPGPGASLGPVSGRAPHIDPEGLRKCEDQAYARAVSAFTRADMVRETVTLFFDVVAPVVSLTNPAVMASIYATGGHMAMRTTIANGILDALGFSLGTIATNGSPYYSPVQYPGLFDVAQNFVNSRVLDAHLVDLQDCLNRFGGGLQMPNGNYAGK